ncbi:MAG: PP2C family protein-serine/threonine phosphatase, partial [bacterium]
MARLVSDFRFQTQIERDPERILSTINNLLVERSRRGMFVTLQYLLLDTPTGLMQVASAGHLPMIRIDHRGEQCNLINGESSAPLGIIENMEFSCQTVRLEPGDILVCFTDGIIEAKNKNGKQYTLDRLKRFLRQVWDSPEQIVEDVIANVNEFARSVAQHDDLTVTALQWAKQ